MMGSTSTKLSMIICFMLSISFVLQFNTYTQTLYTSSTFDNDENLLAVRTDARNDNENIQNNKTIVTDTSTEDHGDTGKSEGDNESPSSSCSTFQNSNEWLTRPRHSNINETLMTDEYIQKLILHISPTDTYSNNGSKEILGQSICLPDSTFMNWDYTPRITHSGNSDNDINRPPPDIVILAFRLIFLAIHEHQYGPARLEAMARYNKDNTCNDNDDHKKYMASLQNANVGKLDYECPDTKFLLSNIPGVGFGASLRVGMIDPLFVGLATNRTVLYVTSLKDITDVDRAFTSPWPLASCPRKDMQCVYMPFSPCVLTKEDIKNGLLVPSKNVVNARNTGLFGDGYDDAKVLMMKSDGSSHKPTPRDLMLKVVNIIQSFYDSSNDGASDIVGTAAAWQLDQETLGKVYKFLLEPSKYNMWLPHQVASLYLMRPNMESRAKVDNAMQRILPENFDPSKTVGFPIRGSDKCYRESECLSFSDYIQVMREFITKREKVLADQGHNTTITHVMLTSEHKEIINARLDYVNNSTFPYDFIINEEDAGQGTGNPKKYHESADNIMVSSLISLQMQLNTESIVYNDCSNFHKLMVERSLYDCGLHNYFETYKQNDNPKFRMRCAWGRV